MSSRTRISAVPRSRAEDPMPEGEWRRELPRLYRSKFFNMRHYQEDKMNE